MKRTYIVVFFTILFYIILFGLVHYFNQKRISSQPHYIQRQN
ncbi:MAG: hypothetical protein JWQ79_386 [Mucilaginibacter sp.]|jgi:hypothetical protein|nr:hypothetical protein [Mucilaginibacter sp.]